MSEKEAMEQFVCRMRYIKGSSEKYGPCEVCSKHADSVYLLSEMKPFYSEVLGRQGKAHIRGVFGHKDCLAQETVKRTREIPYQPQSF